MPRRIIAIFPGIYCYPRWVTAVVTVGPYATRLKALARFPLDTPIAVIFAWQTRTRAELTVEHARVTVEHERWFLNLPVYGPPDGVH